MAVSRVKDHVIDIAGLAVGGRSHHLFIPARNLRPDCASKDSRRRIAFSTQIALAFRDYWVNLTQCAGLARAPGYDVHL